MSDRGSIANLRVYELLARIGSHPLSPDAGAAGASALALGAACVSKAAGVSLKHRPEDRELQCALETSSRIMAAALVEADRDSGAFEASIRNKGVAALGRLVSEAERIKQLIDDLANAIEQVADTSQPNMTGDIVAARALATAARQIQERNEEEAIQQR